MYIVLLFKKLYKHTGKTILVIYKNCYKVYLKKKCCISFKLQKYCNSYHFDNWLSLYVEVVIETKKNTCFLSYTTFK